jgi:RNA polymerase sigma-70 factor (ECF subfamily)
VDSIDDRELVARATAGDDAAFEQIYRRHAQPVFTLLTRLLGPDRDREDLLQDVFVRLHAALARFRGEASLLTLVYRITTCVAIDHMRRRKPVELVDQIDDEIDPNLSPADQSARREEIRGALALLARLKPKHRVAFVLREVMGLSHEEVARIVGAHPAAARMRVAAAKRQLARLAAREESS